MTVSNDKLQRLSDEVGALKDAEMDRLRKEVSFLKELQRRRGLSSTNMLSRDECIGFLEIGIAGFIQGS